MPRRKLPDREQDCSNTKDDKKRRGRQHQLPTANPNRQQPISMANQYLFRSSGLSLPKSLKVFAAMSFRMGGKGGYNPLFYFIFGRKQGCTQSGPWTLDWGTKHPPHYSLWNMSKTTRTTRTTKVCADDALLSVY